METGPAETAANFEPTGWPTALTAPAPDPLGAYRAPRATEVIDLSSDEESPPTPAWLTGLRPMVEIAPVECQAPTAPRPGSGGARSTPPVGAAQARSRTKASSRRSTAQAPQPLGLGPERASMQRHPDEITPWAPDRRSGPRASSSPAKHQKKQQDQFHISISKVFSLSGRDGATQVKITVPEARKSAPCYGLAGRSPARAAQLQGSLTGRQSTFGPAGKRPRSDVGSSGSPRPVKKTCLEDFTHRPHVSVTRSRPPTPAPSTATTPSDYESSIVTVVPPVGLPLPSEAGQMVEFNRDFEPVEEVIVLDEDEDTSVGLAAQGADLDPVQSFLACCQNLLPTDELATVGKKLGKLVKASPPEWLESAQLSQLVATKTSQMKSDSPNVYIYIKEVMDEFRTHKRSGPPRSMLVTPQRDIETEPNAERETPSIKLESPPKKRPFLVPVQAERHPYPGPEAGTTPARDTRGPEANLPPGVASTSTGKKSSSAAHAKPVSSVHLKKLARARKQLHRAIQDLEVAECNLDAEEDSSYLKLCRYKRRYIQIDLKIAEYLNEDPSIRRRQDKKFKFQGSRIPEVNLKIEKWVNRARRKKQECFPDFADVLNLVKAVNAEKNIGLSKQGIENEAKEAFEAVGTKLKLRRLHDDQEVLESYLPKESSMEEPEELKQKLDANMKLGNDNLNQVFDKFARQEADSGELPVEVADDESDAEAKDEDEAEEDLILSELIQESGPPSTTSQNSVAPIAVIEEVEVEEDLALTELIQESGPPSTTSQDSVAPIAVIEEVEVEEDLALTELIQGGDPPSTTSSQYGVALIEVVEAEEDLTLPEVIQGRDPPTKSSQNEVDPPEAVEVENLTSISSAPSKIPTESLGEEKIELLEV
eukprot:maker-scaffold1210_size55525-snap-gene-0.24 protein:Tk07926 transcript:maker-scaffold1210_size55525-snap-gene-0.24-mRNA-1 annotation:"death domain-associated protein 6"